MKKNYLTKSIGSLLVATLSVCTLQAQTLECVKSKLNTNYTNVTAVIPNVTIWDYDGFNDINDGINDMYDGGNILNTDITTGIPYSDDVILNSTDFGTTGRYFTREYPGLFVMVADLDNVSSFYITGNLGADGDGSVDTYDYSLLFGGIQHDVFIKRVYGAGDPSVNHAMIIPSNPAVTHGWASTDTNDDADSLNNLNGTTRVYYFLFSSMDQVQLDNNTVEQIVFEFMNATASDDVITVNQGNGLIYCENDMITLTATGPNAPYVWDSGITDGMPFSQAIGTQMYTVGGMGSDGCLASNTVSVEVRERPIISVMANDEMFGNDGSVNLSILSGYAPFTFDWDNDGVGDNDDSNDLYNIADGTYTVIMTDGSGCSTTASATVGSQLGINELNGSVEIYPNPTKNDLNIKFDGEYSFELVSMTGERLTTGTATNFVTIPMDNYANGMYLLKIKSGELFNTIQVVKQ